MKSLNYYTTDPLLLLFPNFIENVRKRKQEAEAYPMKLYLTKRDSLRIKEMQDFIQEMDLIMAMPSELNESLAHRVWMNPREFEPMPFIPLWEESVPKSGIN